MLLFKVQQSLEKISKLEQEKEHWMLEAQLAKIKLEKENQRIADKLKSASSGQLVGPAQENAVVSHATGQEEAAAKAVSEPIQSTSLVSVFMISLPPVFLFYCYLIRT
jgi:protein phosphatase 1 regulatory subunit 21